MSGMALLTPENQKPPYGGMVERLTLGSDFSLSRPISGAARSILRTAKVTRFYDTTLKLLYTVV